MVRHHRGALKTKRNPMRGYAFHQVGTTTKSVDRKRRAKPIGWRKKGKTRVFHPKGLNWKTKGVYFENRANRSDHFQGRKAKEWL